MAQAVYYHINQTRHDGHNNAATCEHNDKFLEIRNSWWLRLVPLGYTSKGLRHPTSNPDDAADLHELVSAGCM